MADVLAYAEARDGALRPVAREVVSAARTVAGEVGGEVHALVLGGPGTRAAAHELGRFGAERILVAEDEACGLYSPDAATAALAGVAASGEYEAILFPASAQGKDLAPRLAARLGRALATEVTGFEFVEGDPVVRRPVYAGKAYARLVFRERPLLASLRPNVFPVRERPAGGAVEALEVPSVKPRTRVLGVERGEREALDVREAGIVVSGGRGMQGPEHWHLLEDLVTALGPEATLGASRAVVDAGWRSHSEQVGQTGKVVSPNLYFAIGISGAIQHLAGMRTANVIVAVNRDREAPIFTVANYGVVGDVFEVVPRLTEEIREMKDGG